jgi:hypothetical protein
MRGMYIIRLERKNIEGEPVVIWLSAVVPQRWGEQAAARRFRSKGEARIAAQAAKVRGAWSIEEVES